jgi:hypothetical protein
MRRRISISHEERYSHTILARLPLTTFSNQTPTSDHGIAAGPGHRHSAHAHVLGGMTRPAYVLLTGRRASIACNT